MSKTHIPCDFCKKGPLENCPEVIYCNAEWDEDPDGCEDCKVESSVIYKDNEPYIVVDPEEGARPYDPRFDNCQILTDGRIVSIEDEDEY